METLTAASLAVGGIYFVFSDGELSQISQAQEIPCNRKTCSVLHELKIKGIAEATGCEFIAIKDDSTIEEGIKNALAFAARNKPVIVEVTRINQTLRMGALPQEVFSENHCWNSG